MNNPKLKIIPNTNFKKTEIGLIPEDWQVKRLGDVFEILKTANYSREKLLNYGKIKYIHYGDVHTKFLHFLDLTKAELQYIDEKEAKGYPLIKEGDIIMPDVSEDYEGIGKFVEVKNVNEVKAISGLHTFLLRDKDKYFVNGYKAFITANKSVKKLFELYSTGLKVYGISKSVLKSLLIPLPPKEEQEAIATILSDFDRLIEALDKLISKKKAIKQAAMQDLLTAKKRLPGFSQPWIKKKLGEVAEIYQPQTISNKDFTKEGYNVFGANGLIGKYYKYNHEKWQVIITCRGSTSGTVSKTTDKSWITGNAMVLNVDNNENIDKNFWFYLISNQDFKKLVTGSGQPQIIRKPLLTFEILLPPSLDEQRAIAKILSDMDAEIEALTKKKHKYQLLKQAAMDLLLTGKVRVMFNEGNERNERNEGNKVNKF